MNTVLVAIDGSEASDRALDFAINMARNADAGLLVLNAIQETALVPVPMGVMSEVDGAYLTNREAMQTAAAELTEQAMTRAEIAGLENVERLVRIGAPAKVIVEVADEENADVIVMGRRGLTDFTGLLLGSVTHKVCHLAGQAVVTVP